MAPPVPTRLSAWARSVMSMAPSAARTCSRSAANSSGRGGSWRRNASPSRRAPSGSVIPARKRRLAKAATPMLPPPRSTTAPLSTGSPDTAPTSARRASSSPLSTVMLRPVRRWASVTKPSRLAASRTAEVATTLTARAPCRRAMVANAVSVWTVRLSAARLRRPLASTSRIRRRATRASARTSRWPCSVGRTTRSRAEFEPMSATARGAEVTSEPRIGSGNAASVAGAAVHNGHMALSRAGTSAAPTEPDGDKQEAAPRYLNRDVAWLDFNRRVLALASDEGVPVLERARFLAIAAHNLDEFFQVRGAVLAQNVETGLRDRSPEGLTTLERRDLFRGRTRGCADDQDAVYTKSVAPALDAAGI